MLSSQIWQTERCSFLSEITKELHTMASLWAIDIFHQPILRQWKLTCMSLFYRQTVKMFIDSQYFWYSYIGTDTDIYIDTGASLALIWKHSKIVLIRELVVISVASYSRYKHHIPLRTCTHHTHTPYIHWLGYEVP